MPPIVWIVIVNYRTSGLVVDCLNSLSSQIKALGGGHVLVVDNDSADNSFENINNTIIDYKWTDWAEIIPSGKNGGFSFGNNLGIRKAMLSDKKPDYILLLNPDTVVIEGAIFELVTFMNSHSAVGIAGSRLQNINNGIESSAHIFPSPLGELEGSAKLKILSNKLHKYIVTPNHKNTQHSCDWVSGASMIVRREVFENIGLLDEGYFLYYEEVDFCQRAKNMNWECWYVPESLVTHYEGAATDIGSRKRRPTYWYDSRRRYFIKHYGVSGLVLADSFWFVGHMSYLVRRLLRLGAQKENSDPQWLMFDLLWGDTCALFSKNIWHISRRRSQQ